MSLRNAPLPLLAEDTAREDTGFDDSVLSEFRQRLVKHELAQALFERVLGKLQAIGLVQKGARQRTDATAVLAATQVLARVQLVAETMRLAVAALAAYRSDRLRSIALPPLVRALQLSCDRLSLTAR